MNVVFQIEGERIFSRPATKTVCVHEVVISEQIKGCRSSTAGIITTHNGQEMDQIHQQISAT